ncbi:MAG: DsbA family protein [Acidobacteriota bacterium]|jgi:predicted DsbA family dithiol-disulfide isomerase
MGDTTVRLTHFSDVCCIWAYVSHVRLEELRSALGDRLQVEHRFVPVFGAARERIRRHWDGRGGFDGYARHVQEIAARFPHVEVDPAVWSSVRPRSSSPAHLLLKAVQLLEDGASLVAPAAWAVREAFFREGRDIGCTATLLEVAGEQRLPVGDIGDRMESGAAMAALCRDVELRDELRVEGSPTYLLNQGRQKLYGDVGYRVLEANIQELLRQPDGGASWC